MSIGTQAEWDVKHDLTNRFGYAVMRAAGSHGAADLAAFGLPDVLLVQVKRVPAMPFGVAAMSPDERRDLLRLARRVQNGRPVLALRVKGITTPIYRELTGRGPDDWRDFHPTEQATE